MDPVKSVQEGRNGTGIPARVGEAAYLRFQSRSTMDLLKPVQKGRDGTGIGTGAGW